MSTPGIWGQRSGRRTRDRASVPPFGTPELTALWQKAGELGLLIQVHLLPRYAPAFAPLIAASPTVPVLIDHLGRPGQGTAEEYEGVLRLAQFEQVSIKLSGVSYISQEPFPHRDAQLLVRRVVETFGSERVVWGDGYTGGLSAEAYAQAPTLVDALVDWLPEAERARIRGETAARLFRF